MKQRYYSLDVFRGATVCLMILVNNPGSWSHIFAPLGHAKWHGLTPTDLVFPFFLFAVGNALSFVMPRLEASGDKAFWQKVVKRTALIFLIGLFLNWWPFVKWQDGVLVFKYWADPANTEGGIRILGVLQRIALAYFFASVIIYYFKLQRSYVIALILLLVYWALCLLGNPADPYSMTGWWGNIVDKSIIGVRHMYKGEGIPFEPEGLLSTIPAIAQVIFGYIVGDYIQKKGNMTEPGNFTPVYKMLTGLFVAAAGLLVTAYFWDLVFPINKKIWTSSYVLCTTGMAMMIMGVMIYAIEIKQYKGFPTRFFDVFGKNPLFVFALSAFLPKTLSLIRIPYTNSAGKEVYSTPWSYLYDHIFIHIPGRPEIGSLLYALCVITLMWAICYWLDKKKIYIKV